jgi:membrane fusion protein, heavy metal efflux system
MSISNETSQAPAERNVVLSETQFASIKIAPVGEYMFPQEKQAVGNIDFNQELLSQVFTQFQGRIIQAFAKVGEIVKKDQVLFTIDSPDLLQAESTLISTAAVLELTTKAMERLNNLFKQSAAAQKDYQQAVSDHQTAEGGYRAARATLNKVFGKTDAEMDRIVADRKVDPVLAVSSPITGLITSRNAAPGLFVQPGIHHPFTSSQTHPSCGCWRTCPKKTLLISRSDKKLSPRFPLSPGGATGEKSMQLEQMSI